MKLIDILVERLPALGGWPIDSDDERTLISSLPGVSWGLNGGGYYAFRGPNDSITYQQYEAALVASKTEWNGRGLPPSGVEFEYLRGDFGADEGRWVKCTMKYAGEKFCIVHLDGEGEGWLKHEGTQIRPIRSEADKKRAEGVIALSRIDPQAMPFEYGDKHSDGSLIGPFWYELYDAIAAGKIPHIRID